MASELEMLPVIHRLLVDGICERVLNEAFILPEVRDALSAAAQRFSPMLIAALKDVAAK